MSLLSLKRRKFSVGLLCIATLFFSFIELQETQDSFEDECKNADAYYAHSYTDVTYETNWGRYKKYISIDYKLVINNSNGAEEYAFLNLSKYRSNHLEKIEVKTLKSDGTVVRLDSSLVFKKKDKNKLFDAIKYPIPAVEPGDTIAISYVYYEFLKKSNLLSYVNLYDNLPNVNAQYSIKTKPGLSLRYKQYNGFPKPEVVSNDSIVYVQFSMDKLKGYQENQYSCVPCELPYLYYTLGEKDDKLRTWKDVYNEEFNTLTQPLYIDYDRATYYKRWKRRIIGKAKDSSKYYKFNLLFNEVLNNFKMTELVPSEFIKSNGYFLKEKKFDPVSIRRFYRQILEDLEINYWAVFAKSKRSGSIDNNYIRRNEFDHVFFAFEQQDGTVHFLYPHSEVLKYNVDELPTNIYNTKAILVKPNVKSNVKKTKKDKFITRDFKLAEVDAVSAAEIVLPGMNSAYNSVNQVIFSTVNRKDKKVTFKSRLKVSGGLSTELRDFFNTMSANEEASNYYNALSEYEGDVSAIQIDSILYTRLNAKKPFSFTLNAAGEVKNTITFLNDSLASLSLDKLLNHSQIETGLETSDLDYYLDFTYSDNLLMNIAFDVPIEILGIENGSFTFTNEFGEYQFKIQKTKKNELKLVSLYKIKKNIIPKEKYSDLKMLNSQVKKAKSKRFIIKLKS